MLGCGWVSATPIHAAETGFLVGLTLAHDSNIALVETNPKSDWTESLRAGLFYRENTVDVTARVLAQVERRHFYYKSFPDDTTAFVDAAGVWTISPRQLTWTGQDTFRDVQRNISAPNTPSNLTKSNTLSTGPDLTLSMSSTNSAVIGGRYGRFDIKDSNSDSLRYTGYLRGVHAMSPQTKLSLNYEATSMYFVPGAQVYSKVFREDWFGRYENLSALNTTVLDLGTSRATTYGGPPVGRSRLVRLSSSEKLSSQSTLRLALSDQISDTYTDLLAGVTGSTVPRDPAVAVPVVTTFASGDLYHSQRGELTYANNDGRFGYTLQAYGRRIDFETLDQDYQEKGCAFLWTWFYSGELRFDAFAVYARRTYSPVDQTSPLEGRRDSDLTYNVSGTYKLNGKLTLAMYVGRVERQSTAPLSSYVDNRVVLALSYSSDFTDGPRR